MKLFVGGLVVAVMTSVASAGFVIQDLPVGGGSWTQHIVAAGPFDYLGFEFLEGTGGPFQPPGITDFVDHSAGFPPPSVSTWATFYSTPTFVAATGPAGDFTQLGFDIHFEGDLAQPVRFQAVAFLDDVFQFSAEFVWSGLFVMNIQNIDVWQPDPSKLPASVVPLPAAVWMGSLGILAVLLFRQKIHVI